MQDLQEGSAAVVCSSRNVLGAVWETLQAVAVALSPGNLDFWVLRRLDQRSPRVSSHWHRLSLVAELRCDPSPCICIGNIAAVGRDWEGGRRRLLLQESGSVRGL